MAERQLMTQTINASKARQQWSQVLNKVFRKEARVIVEKSGIPVAAIISADDLERLTRLDAERQRDFAVLDELREAFKDVPPEDVEREVAKALKEVRRERRQKEKPTAPTP